MLIQIYSSNLNLESHSSSRCGRIVYGPLKHVAASRSRGHASCTSTAMPRPLMSSPEGVLYLATVQTTAPPSDVSAMVCTSPLPKVSSPNNVALLLSLSAPAKTSDAEALP